MYYDSHIHSTHSADGDSPLTEYATAVDDGRVAGIGFAEHLDLMPECGSYGKLDYVRYMADVISMREKGYDFYAGCEIDYNKKAEDIILDHLKVNRYHFTMCSIHMIDGVSISNRIYIPSINDLDLLKDIVGKYYQELKWSLLVDAFDVIGHVGVYKRYLCESFRNDPGLSKMITDAENEMAYLCAQNGKLLDVNSSGLFSPLGLTLPDRAFLEQYFEFGGRSICVGSDAHNSKEAGRGIGEVYLLLKEIGFKYVTLPWDKEHPMSL